MSMKDVGNRWANFGPRSLPRRIIYWLIILTVFFGLQTLFKGWQSIRRSQTPRNIQQAPIDDRPIPVAVPQPANK